MVTNTECDKCGSNEKTYKYRDQYLPDKIGDLDIDTGFQDDETHYDLCNRCLTLVEIFIGKPLTKKDHEEYQSYLDNMEKDEPRYD